MKYMENGRRWWCRICWRRRCVYLMTLDRYLNLDRRQYAGNTIQVFVCANGLVLMIFKMYNISKYYLFKWQPLDSWEYKWIPQWHLENNLSNSHLKHSSTFDWILKIETGFDSMLFLYAYQKWNHGQDPGLKVGPNQKLKMIRFSLNMCKRCKICADFIVKNPVGLSHIFYHDVDEIFLPQPIRSLK